ncbi:MAG: UvrD-helicase domain-containing protein, partial [Thermoleophilia bacterium]|nr:UvrD-helicase domain-containing protein [Thermoleophilia bacterium]
MNRQGEDRAVRAVDVLEPSPAQEKIIRENLSRCLVAAGAGSGKTRLLVTAFVHALVDEGWPPERMVAVTFTRKAASELAGRIRAALIACGRADLARSLDAATIGTIHSLCAKLMRTHPLAAGVNPS